MRVVRKAGARAERGKYGHRKRQDAARSWKRSGGIFDAQTDGMITNHIFSMYEILYSALEWKGGRQTRPYVNILEPLTDHEFDLREELAVLRDSISRIMNEVLKLDSANGLGAYMMKDEILSRFFRDYFFMKKTAPSLA